MKIRVCLKERSYDCLIERGLLKEISKFLDNNHKAMFVIDNNVNTDYLDLTYPNAIIYKFKASEHNKSIVSYLDIMKVLVENNFSRNDYVISIGGGVTGDLCGFVAATFKRGCKFINCPTTTLSCIDSSVGGKVAINFEGIKNVVGAFYQPSLVLIDPDVLYTLPQRHFFNGLVEALKMGLIGDQKLYSIFKYNDSSCYINYIEEIIYRSLDLKRKIVEQDEKESSIRKVLNFGHTIGHAIESIHLDEIYHGEAVGLGMLYMIDTDYIVEEVKMILEKMNCCHQINDSESDLLKYIQNDKKADNGLIDIVRVKSVGTAYFKKIPLKDIFSFNCEEFK